LTNGFIGEFLLISGIYQSALGGWMAAVAGLTIILGAVYMLTSYQKICLGEAPPPPKGGSVGAQSPSFGGVGEAFADLTINEKMVLIPLVIMIFWIGVYPKPFLDIAEPSVKNLLDIIHGTSVK
jgi:NADH-quinone oxidoreductase subunit M